MFSTQQKRKIADAVQKILRATNHPELPAGEINFALHVVGAESWSWADIRNNNQDPRTAKASGSGDPVECEEAVINKIRLRRDVGRRKYGVTMERNDLTRMNWLQHAQEEAMDFAIYLEKLLREDQPNAAGEPQPTKKL